MCAIHEHRQHAIRKAVPTYTSVDTCTTLANTTYLHTLLILAVGVLLSILVLFVLPSTALAAVDWTKPQVWDEAEDDFWRSSLPHGVNPPYISRKTHPVYAEWEPSNKTITIRSPNKGIWGCSLGYFEYWGCPSPTKVIIRDPIYINSGTQLCGHSSYLRDAEFIGFEKIDVTYAYSLVEMFYGTTKANPDVSHWNTENVVYMTRMFYGSTATPDVSLWDVGNVRNMEGMFCGSAADPNVSQWDVRNVKTMQELFANCQANPDVSSWDVNNVEDLDRMFARNKVANPDLSRWKISSSHKLSCSAMFMDATAARPDLRFISDYNSSSHFYPLDPSSFFGTNDGLEHYFQPYKIGFGSAHNFLESTSLKTFTAPLADFLEGSELLFKRDYPDDPDHAQQTYGYFQCYIDIPEKVWGLYTEEGLILASWQAPASYGNRPIFRRSLRHFKQEPGHPFYIDLLFHMPSDKLLTVAPAHALRAKPLKMLQGSSIRPTRPEVLAAVFEQLFDRSSENGYSNQTSTASFDLAKSTVSGIENIDTSKPGIVDPALQPRATIVFNDPVPYIDDYGRVVDAPAGKPAFTLKDTIAVPIEVLPNTPIAISVADLNGFSGNEPFTAAVTLKNTQSHAQLMTGEIYKNSQPNQVLRTVENASRVEFAKDETLLIRTLKQAPTDDDIDARFASESDNPKNFKLHLTIDGVSDPGQVTRTFTTSFTQAGGSQDASAYVEQPNVAATHADTALELNFAIPPDAEDLHFDIGLERPLRELTAVQDAPDSPWNILMLMCAGVGSLACIGLGTGFYLRRFRQRRA